MQLSMCCILLGAYTHFRGGIAKIIEEVWKSGQPNFMNLRISQFCYISQLFILYITCWNLGNSFIIWFTWTCNT